MPLAASFRTKNNNPTPDQHVSPSHTTTSALPNPLQVGDRVDLPKQGWTNCGTVRYRGPLQGVPQSGLKIYLGIELDAPNGKHNGTAGGVQVFECREQCGVFCRPQMVRRTGSSTTKTNTPDSATNQRRDQSNHNSRNSNQKPQRGGGRTRPRPPSNRDSEHTERPTRSNTKPKTKTATRKTPSPVASATAGTSLGKKRQQRSDAAASTMSSHMHRGRRTFDPSLSKIPGIKGLKNLGNTCFVNSVLQNINNLPPVRDYYLQSLMAPRNGGSCGALTLQVAAFVREMWLSKETVVTPKNVFVELCKRVPRFGHRQQQDAVEALRYLFDGLDTEAIKTEQLHSKAMGAGMVSPSSMTPISSNENISQENTFSSSPSSSPLAAAAAATALSPQPCGLAVAKSGLVAEIFSGILCSEISCDHCHHVSRVKERYSDLSLPIPSRLLSKSKKKHKSHQKPGQQRGGGGSSGGGSGGGSGGRTRARNSAAAQVSAPTTNAMQPMSPSSSPPTLNKPPVNPIDVDHEIAQEMQKEEEEQQQQRDQERIAFEQELLSKQTNNGTGMMANHTTNVGDDVLTTTTPVQPRTPPPTVHDHSESGIETCMNHFFASELLEGRDCDQCTTRSNAQRRYVLSDPLPKVLIIHVKRFAQTLTGRLKKINNFVSYPIELNVEKYCSSKLKQQQQQQQQQQQMESTGTKHIDPHAYELSGVVVHGGTLHGGHYSAFIRRVSSVDGGHGVSSTGRTDGGPASPSSVAAAVDWIYISDARVRMATKEEALKRHGAYLLFYTRRDVATRAPTNIPLSMLEQYIGTAVDVDELTCQLKRQTLQGSGGGGESGGGGSGAKKKKNGGQSRRNGERKSERIQNQRRKQQQQFPSRDSRESQQPQQPQQSQQPQQPPQPQQPQQSQQSQQLQSEQSQPKQPRSISTIRVDSDPQPPPSPPTPCNNNNRAALVQFPPVQNDASTSKAKQPMEQKRTPPLKAKPASTKNSTSNSLPRLSQPRRANSGGTGNGGRVLPVTEDKKVDAILRRREERIAQRKSRVASSASVKENTHNGDNMQSTDRAESTGTGTPKLNPKQWLQLLKKKKIRK